MPQSEVNEYIEISDFTAGIHSGYNSQTTSSGNVAEPAADGAAQLEGTWGCVGLPNGGLTALPAIQDVYTIEIDDPTGRGTYYDGNTPFVYILDILNFPGVRPPDYLEDTGTKDAHPIKLDANNNGVTDFFLMILQRYYDDAGGGTFKRSWTAQYFSPFLDSAMDAINVKYAATNPYPAIDWTGDYTDAATDGAVDYGFGCIDLGRTNSATPTEPGQPQFRFGIGGRLNITDEDGPPDVRSIYVYPEYLLNGVVTTVKTGVSPALVLSHQGRLVWADANAPAAGNLLPGPRTWWGANWVIGAFSSAGVVTTEQMYWTLVNSKTIDNTTGTVFVEENPVGLGAWASMNASELFLVKHYGGAVVVRGSLNNPTVVRLPGVESTFGTVSHPVVTPLGCIYGTRTGVWVWNGSDTAECLSPNLDGFFWAPNHFRVDELHPAQACGRFGYHYPYVFAPNNFVMDVRTKGWFRLNASVLGEDMIYAHYNTSLSDLVYASPLALTVPEDGSDFDQQYLHSFNMTKQTTEWYWTSQPLQRTRNRRIDFRELAIVAQGYGTITFTVKGLNDSTETEVVEFEFNSPTRPIALVKPFSMSSHDVVVEIHSEVNNLSQEGAPTLYRMSLGHRPAQGITNLGSVGGNV